MPHWLSLCSRSMPPNLEQTSGTKRQKHRSYSFPNACSRMLRVCWLKSAASQAPGTGGELPVKLCVCVPESTWCWTWWWELYAMHSIRESFMIRKCKGRRRGMLGWLWQMDEKEFGVILSLAGAEIVKRVSVYVGGGASFLRFALAMAICSSNVFGRGGPASPPSNPACVASLPACPASMVSISCRTPFL